MLDRVSGNLVALPFLGVAFGLHVAVAGRWPVHSAAGLGALAASVVVPLACYVVIARRRPSGLVVDVDRRRFVAKSGVSVGVAGIVAGWAIGGFARDSVIVTAVVLAFLAGALLRDRPMMVFEPDGFELLNLFGGVRAGWDELAPGHPQAPAAPGPAILLARRADGRTLKLPVAGILPGPAFLARVIRTYVEDPAARDTIGTPYGLGLIEGDKE